MTAHNNAVPAVSVVVPYFNSGRWIRDCIEALLAADAEPGAVELIFVDNGSTDDSAAVAAEYAQLIRLEESTPGAYPARNTGIAAARAPIIAFTDADCTVDRGWFKALRRVMSDEETGIVIGHCRYPDGVSAALRLVESWENTKAAYIAESCSAAHRIAYCNNMAVRASLFEQIGLFPPWKRAGDSEFAHRMGRERPQLGFRFEPSMRITHHEFLRARDRLERLRLYTQTNTKIDGFQELSLAQRLKLLGRAVRRLER